MPADAAIEVVHLSHQYGPRRALDSVSFEVRRGETFALLGPNGGGKTTLFRILSTALTPTEGTARVLGYDIRTHGNEVRQCIGVVFQHPSLDKKLTVLENLLYHGRLYGLGGKELSARTQEMMDRLGVADRAGDLGETLSGGLARRVELAKGLLHRPQVLILDEPSAGLDPGARRDLWLYLQKLRERDGVTILVTTHLIDEADHSDHVLILSEGRVVAAGTPETLKGQIGGDVVAISSRQPDQLKGLIRQKFGVEPLVMNGTLRIETRGGHAFVSQLVESFSEIIDSVTLSKPTLEDVFIDRTGHRFWEDA